MRAEPEPASPQARDEIRDVPSLVSRLSTRDSRLENRQAFWRTRADSRLDLLRLDSTRESRLDFCRLESSFMVAKTEIWKKWGIKYKAKKKVIFTQSSSARLGSTRLLSVLDSTQLGST